MDSGALCKHLSHRFYIRGVVVDIFMYVCYDGCIMAKVRTTVVLPEEDVRLIKLLAASYGLTMSEIIQEGVRRIKGESLKKESPKKKKGWWKVIGSFDLGGKEPPSRKEVYDRYLRKKLSR